MNFNDYCWVRLTDAGREIHKRLFDELRVHCSGLAYEPPPAINGWSRFQLWELMRDFGKHCYNGQMKLPFGTEILFADPNSPSDATLKPADPICDCGHARSEHTSIESAPILKACTVEDCGCMDFASDAQAPLSGTSNAGGT
jgi:hypothetical protein